MRFLGRVFAGIFLAGLTLALLVTAGGMVRNALQERQSREPFRPMRNEQVAAVNVVTFQSGNIHPVITVFGAVQSGRSLELRVPRGGPVVQISPDFVAGGIVAEGALLLSTDSVDEEQAVARATTNLSESEAALAEARASVLLAQDDLRVTQDQAALRQQALARQKDLLERGAGTEANIETAALAASQAEQAVLSKRQALVRAEASVKQAENALSLSQLSLDESKRQLKDTALYAEFAGVLGEVSIVQGGLVNNNEKVGQLIDPTRLEVAFRVSNAQYARLLDSAGALSNADVTVKMDLSGYSATARGRIQRESAIVESGQTGRQLFAQLRVEDAFQFRPGDFVSVEITEPELQGVAVLPATAVDASGRVLVIGPEDRLVETAVTVLRRQGDDVIVRVEGLDGEKLVAERTPLLGEGLKVRPLDPDAPSVVDPQSSAPSAAPDNSGETVDLNDERRAALIAKVQENTRMPDVAKTRILEMLAQDSVPKQLIDRIESGGGR